MKIIFLSLVIFFLYPKASMGQIDNIGSGRAVEFDGVDDYIDFGDRYSDLTFPFTVSAWVYLKPSFGSSPIFVSRNNDPLYNGFWFTVYSEFIFIEYGDGLGGNNPAFRRGKKATVTGMIGRWNHVSAVVRGVSDIDLYLNGINVGNESTGGSNSPMNSNILGGHSTAGSFLSNGVTYKCTGIIDDIRLWNKALSQEEIRQTMCINLKGNEPGLIGYWDFNETNGNIVFDKSTNKFNGQFVGNPNRVFSGAPVGDVSTYVYSSSWAGASLSLQDGDHKMEVDSIVGLVEGIQMYEVENLPSQTNGLDPSEVNQPYFGVFLVSQYSNCAFDATYTFQNQTPCKSFSRDDNSNPLWGKIDNPTIQKSQRAEFLKASGGSLVNFDLGNNKIVCDLPSYEVSTGIDDPQFLFEWSTGENTPSISVSHTGLYSVKVTGPCNIDTDTVGIVFINKPLPISLGLDNEFCVFNSLTLQPVENPSGLIFLWQDGSSNPTFEAKEYGKYWVVVKNLCGQESDSVTYSKLINEIGFVPNVITPNGDVTPNGEPKNEYFVVNEDIVGLVSLQVFNRWGKEVYYSSAYDNKWNGGDLPSGVYYILLQGPCIGKTKSPLSIIR